MLPRLRSVVMALVATGVWWAPAAAVEIPQQAAVTIIVNNRNGGPILALVVLEIRQLQKDARFSEYLVPPPPDQAQASCIAGARKDPSGRAFDIARCMAVWPQEDMAPILKNVEAAFAGPVGRDGAAALPGIKVTPYVYSQILGEHEFDAFRGDKLVEDDNGLKPTDSFLKVLCSPQRTLLPYADCAARVTVVDRVVYEPDIFVGQIGYRVEVLGKMPVATALAFRQALLAGVQLDRGTRKDALRVTIIDNAPVRKQQRAADAAPAAPNAIDQLWQTVHARPGAIELMPNTDDNAPALLLFDGVPSDKAGSFRDWVQDLNAGLGHLTSADCPAPSAPMAHTDAVASLLMPAGMAPVFSSPGHAAQPLSFPSFPSFIFTPDQFKGDTVLGDSYTWSDRQGLQLNDDGVPVVALVVYDAGIRADNAAAAQLALGSYLGNRSNIVVVSAASWTGAAPPPRFPPGDPTYNEKTISYNCSILPWPSCLGAHPQVVVVGPTGAPTDHDRTVFAPDKYVLGGFVRVAAPSAGIPVLMRCGGTDGAWSIRVLDGTSFGAPLVALLLAKIIQLGPDSVRSLPETAIWRIEATANPMGAGDTDNLTGFGEIDAGRALRGASAAEAGEWSAAAIYEDGADTAKPGFGVVMPYPWNDVPKNLEEHVGPANRPGIEARNRSSATFTFFDAAGKNPQMHSLDFTSILRIARRTDVTPDQGRLFDVYYVNPDDPKLRYVSVLRRARFGPINLTIGNPGYCRTDQSQPAQTQTSDIEPSCLYVWKAGTSGFVTLDLANVQDLVFPQSHIRAHMIKSIVPTDFARVVQSDSPWATEFCAIGLRHMVVQKLTEYHRAVPDIQKACATAAGGPP